MENNLNLEQIFVSDNLKIIDTGGLIVNNILDMRLHEFFFISIYFILFIFFVKFIIKSQKLNKNKVYFLISYHYFFIILAYVYSLLYVNDTDSFFQQAYLFNENDDIQMANNNMSIINHYLIYIFNLHYFTIFIFLGFFSSIGFLFLFISFSKILSKFQLNKNLLFGILLFPSWHFFTSFPGKDAIFLFSLGLLCFYFIKKNFFYLIISIILIYSIRPHVAYMVLISGLLVWLHYFLMGILKSKIIYFFSIVLIFTILAQFLKIINPYYFDLFVNFSEKGAMFRNYSIYYSGWYETGNNIFSNSLKYLFYPLFDFSNLNRFIISFENILILLFFLRVTFNYDQKIFNQMIKKKEMLFSILFFTIMLVALSNFTANIGISARQKWMMMPFLFLLIIPFLGKFKSIKS